MSNKITLNDAKYLQWEVPDSQMGAVLAVLKRVARPLYPHAKRLCDEQGNRPVFLNMDEKIPQPQERVEDAIKRYQGMGSKLDETPITAKPPGPAN